MLSLSFAKLVATPTDESWSQVYNAGNLFACLSLSKSLENEEHSLNSIGKEMFSNLEAEFFSLEDKNLKSIKEAIANSTHIIPSGVAGNLCLAYFIGNILYLFIYGAGTIIMKRGEKAGTLLEVISEDNTEILSSSGYLEQNDTIVIQTPQFAKDMPLETVSSSLELNLPSDIAEALSPAMHEKNDGGQAAIVINYKESPKAVDEIIAKEQEEERDDLSYENDSDEMTLEKAILEDSREPLTLNTTDLQHSQKNASLSKFQIPSFLINLSKNILKKTNISGLDHRKKIFLTIAILIGVILIISISLTHKQQEQTKTSAQFKAIYEPALKNYEEGEGIKSINSDFARSDFQKAEKILKDGQDKFQKGSKEEKQISDLLVKVEAELSGTTSVSKITPKETTLPDTDLLSVEKANSGIAFAQNKDAVNMLTDSAVAAVDSAGKEKNLIKNDKDWEKGVGLSTYQGNIFVLDQKNGVLKFTAGGDGFGKSSYLKDKPDLSAASAIAIDGSVWILLKDGNILKYTKGAAEDFKVKGMDKPAKSATRLYANIDIENLYVLDPGNSRIIKINKEGKFQTQYVANILKNAKDLEVSEKDGKIIVLSGNKFWEIPL